MALPGCHHQAPWMTGVSSLLLALQHSVLIRRQLEAEAAAAGLRQRPAAASEPSSSWPSTGSAVTQACTVSSSLQLSLLAAF
jgi:hypothetical protein